MKYSITKLTTKSNYNINYIFENYPELIDKKIKDTYFIKLLYTLIYKASITKNKHTLITKENVRINPKDNFYLHETIKTYIKSINYTLHSIQYIINDVTINVKIYTNEKININKYIYFIKLILNLCINESSQTNKLCNITFYLTPFEKEINTKTVEPIHINSGYTDPNNDEIVIFRKEEWYKVFIHECFHLFCLDFSQVSIDFKKIFSVLFFIESEFLFFEALVEYWARTLNIAIISFYTKKNIMYEEFEELFQINISIERVFCIIQMKNILNSVDLTYNKLITEKCEYKENTNCFCYYILSALILSHYEQTMNWFVEHNETLLQFNKNTRHVYLFYHYIRSIYKSPQYLKLIDEKPHYELNNICMTAFEIDM